MRRGGTISISGVYGGTADPLPLRVLFDKQVQIRMGQANVLRWVPKDEPGPSDPRSKKTTAQKRRGEGETFGGVDAEQNTKSELYERAARLGVEGRSRMSKRELARAIARKQ